MKRFTAFASFFALTVGLSAISVAAETPVERYGRLAVIGNKIVSEKTENPVQLRGMSYFWSMAGESQNYYNANVVGWLADDWKANLVRAAMGVDEYWGENSSGYLAGNKSGNKGNDERVDDVVNAAINKGIYAIIDWHSHTAHTKTDDAAAFFKKMAQKYKDYPNVIYEIYNEPTVGCGNATVGTTAWNTISPYLQAVTDSIRKVDPNNLIILGTPCYSQRVDIAANTPIRGNNLLYALHFYSNDPNHQATLRSTAQTAIDRGQAIFVSEFGTCNSNGGTQCVPGTSGDNCPKQNDNSHNAAETDIWLDFLDQRTVSWANWSISTKDEAASAIKSGASTSGNWTDANLTPSGAYIRSKLIAAYNREEEQWNTAVLAEDRALPGAQTATESAVSPVNAQPNRFSVGPIPTSLTGSGVNFFWQGKAVTGGSLLIYDAVGNGVKSVDIKDASANGQSRRVIGSWNLTDAKGRRVTAGSYLVRGKLLKQDGSVVPVSSIVVVGK